METAPFDVEYNGFTGGTINAVTKSGTNEFSGSIGYYSIDDSLVGDKNKDDPNAHEKFQRVSEAYQVMKL